MDFDRFTTVLLVLRSDRPELTEEEQAALQDAHLAYLSKLHDDGFLLAAGPLLGEPGETFRGLSVFAVDADRARELAEADPAVRGGKFGVKILPWLVPQGAIAATQIRFPASAAEAGG